MKNAVMIFLLSCMERYVWRGEAVRLSEMANLLAKRLMISSVGVPLLFCGRGTS